MATKSYLDKIREKVLEDASKKSAKKEFNGKEWFPEVGKHTIRILPPVNEDDLFYHTHSYHYLEGVEEGKKGSYVYSQKRYTENGKQILDPIDEAVKEFYEDARSTKDDKLKLFAGSIKRKRNWYFNILYLNPETNAWEHRILVDTSNKAKLARKICSEMGFPLYMDVEDGWIDDSSKDVDAEKEYKDLIDIENGCDFKIVKKKNGENAWDFTYEDSYAMKPRALTKEEKKLLDERVDLKTYIKYEENVEKVRHFLDIVTDRYAEQLSGNKKKENVDVKIAEVKTKVSEVNTQKSDKKDEEDLDDLVKQLSDD